MHCVLYRALYHQMPNHTNIKGFYQMQKKSPRNKTINTTLQDGQIFFERTKRINTPQKDLSKILDSTICGDIFSIAPLLPKSSIDLLIADPPYNLTKSFNGKIFSKKKDSEYEAYTRKWLETIKPLLKSNASIYVCCDWRSSLIIGRVLDEMFCLQNRITWQREKGRGAKSNYKNGLEDIWFATCSKEYVFNLESIKMRKKVIAPYRENGKPKDWVQSENGNYRDTCPSNFWGDITIPFWAMSENTAHPTQKPEKLIAKLILASSNEGQTILDPFAGSGTTSVVAKKLKRHFIGVEIEERYCAWCEERLENALQNPTIQGYEDGVFWERNAL